MRYFLNDTITVRRLKTKSGDRTAYSATATAYEASIQQIGVERSQLLEGTIGKQYYCFVEGSPDILDGDQVIHGNVTYSVKSVKVVDFGSTPHYQLIIVRETEARPQERND